MFSFNESSLENAQFTTKLRATLVHQDEYFYIFPSQILTCFFENIHNTVLAAFQYLYFFAFKRKTLERHLRSVASAR